MEHLGIAKHALLLVRAVVGDEQDFHSVDGAKLPRLSGCNSRRREAGIQNGLRWKTVRPFWLLDLFCYGRQHLSFNPLAVLAIPSLSRIEGLPSEILEDLRIIAVAPVYSLWERRACRFFELDSGNLFHDVYQLVDGYELTAAKINGLTDVALQNRLRALGTVVDIHKAARLMAVAPYLDFVLARRFRLNDLAANCRRGLLTASVIGA